MGISSVSSAAGTTYTSAISMEIASLEKQKSALEKDLRTESQSKDDAKTKALKVKQLQIKIQQLATLIQQKESAQASQTQTSTKTAATTPKATTESSFNVQV